MIYANGLKLLEESDKSPNWNLLTGTSDWSGQWVNNSVQYSKTNSYDSNGNLLLHYIGAWNGIYKPVKTIVGNFYTFSFLITNFKSSSTINLYSNSENSFLALFVDHKQVPTGPTIDKKLLEDGNEHKIDAMYQSNTTEAFWARAEKTTSDGSMDLSSMKLECGTVPTPWMPAIADLALKSDLGGVKPSYMLYYATSREVA